MIDLDTIPEDWIELPDGVTERKFKTESEMKAFLDGLDLADPEGDIIQTGDFFSRDGEFVVRYKNGKMYPAE